MEKDKIKISLQSEWLSKVIRARFYLLLPYLICLCQKILRKLIVDYPYAGKGLSALKYLSSYLYQWVINDKYIISNRNGLITFSYIESNTGSTKYRTLKGE